MSLKPQQQLASYSTKIAELLEQHGRILPKKGKVNNADAVEKAYEIVKAVVNLNTQVWLEVTMNNSVIGRIGITLFNKDSPYAAGNFRGLCTSEFNQSDGTVISYRRTLLHYIEGDLISGGDNTFQNDIGLPIYGEPFPINNSTRVLNEPYVVGLVCAGGKVGAKFIIALSRQTILDDVVIVGRVNYGFETLQYMKNVGRIYTMDNIMFISSCGECPIDYVQNVPVGGGGHGGGQQDGGGGHGHESAGGGAAPPVNNGAYRPETYAWANGQN